MIEVKKVEEKTEGGIILSQATTEKEQHGAYEGTVLAIGKLCWKDILDGEPWCEVGDKVLFHRYSGARVDPSLEDRRVLVSDLDILAVVTDDG